MAEAIAAETGLAPTIKHPNDVLVGGRKVAGVLAEAADGRVVLGVGVNVSQTAAELPPEANATSLTPRGRGRRRPVDALLATVLERLEAALRRAGSAPCG